MPKGILKLSKSNKGKIIVALDRLNGKPPMPLAYVSFNNMDLNDKECDFEMNGGKVTKISVDGVLVYPSSTSVPIHSQNSNRKNFAQQESAFRDALDLTETRLPKFVRDLGDIDIDNFSLKYNKASRYIEDAPGKNKFFFFKNDYRTYRDGRPSTGHKLMIRPNYGSLNFENIGKRQATQVKSIFPENKSTIVKIKPDWRLICGLSGGIYETNMTLHHVYGVPYIPASSIKGVIRSWIITKVFGGNAPADEKDYPMVNAEYRALKNNQLFCKIFGAPESIDRVVFENNNPKKKKDKNGKELEEFIKEKEKSALGKEHQGKIVFFEGLPITPPKVEPDVINVHYHDWYKPEGYTPPTDFQSPVPVMFLTVNSESQFQTAIGSHCDKKLSEWSDDFKVLAKPVRLHGNSTIVELMKAWLNLALSEHGIGAKTAVGYGYMQASE